MKCENCGYEIPDGEKQCYHCGAMLRPNRAKNSARHSRGEKGPSARTLILILVVLVIAALIVWNCVYFLGRSGDNPAQDSALSSAPVSSAAAPQVTGQAIGETEDADIILTEQSELFLCSKETGEAQRICGMSDQGVSILSAVYCYQYVYLIERTESYQYLYRVEAKADAEPQKLRLNDTGAQLRTQIEQLFAVNGKLCGFARYPRVDGVSEAYVELYQLNADGLYRASDASTKILYTTQHSEEDQEKDLSLYTVQPEGNGLAISYDGALVTQCEVG